MLWTPAATVRGEGGQLLRKRFESRMIRLFFLCIVLLETGCSLVPQVVRKPATHNPFPQLSKIAIAPFFNQSAEPTVDGRQFALAYFNELQLVPGFDVVPVGVVEQAIKQNKINFNGPEDVRRLARLLGVDAVVIGAVTDFSPYYPPRCTLQIEWWSANECYHPIPPGYGLPWGTTEEEFIPRSLIFEAQFALAKAQLKTQTPRSTQPEKKQRPEEVPPPMPQPEQTPESVADEVKRASFAASNDSSGPADTTSAGMATVPTRPVDWPNSDGFLPPGPSPQSPTCILSKEPVLRHVRAYNGHNEDFVAALSQYVSFRSDARFGGWQGYLQRKDDFIRFCCHMHIHEMLTARGGASETPLVLRWPFSR